MHQLVADCSAHRAIAFAVCRALLASLQAEIIHCTCLFLRHARQQSMPPKVADDASSVTVGVGGEGGGGRGGGNDSRASKTTQQQPPDEKKEQEDTGTGKLRLERSPHPYHRRSTDLPEPTYSINVNISVERRAFAGGSGLLGSAAAQRRAAQYEQDGSSGGGYGYFDLGGDGDGQRKRRKLTSPSDSGTEADDEKPLLKALTAPPLRPRKGLKDAAKTVPIGEGDPLLLPQGDPLASPLLTPSILQDVELFRAGGYMPPKLRPPKERRQSQKRAATADVDEKELERIRERYKRRGRAEFGRRVAETVSLGLIASVSTKASPVSYGWEMLKHLLLVGGIYSCYMLWVFRRRQRQQQLRLKYAGAGIPAVSLPHFFFPAAADPAPLLYPVVIPILVALSLASDNWTVVHANFVLSICSIPRKAIPLHDFNVQWVLSVLPLFYGTEATLRSGIWATTPEMYTFLQPLHHALLPALGFLTTTSLLGTELQLLSITLINLLFFSTSPQNVILKALLWIGGLSLFVACRHVLGWTVSLARVPSWRFRRVNSRWFRNSRVLSAIDDTLGGWLSSRVAASRKADSSDSDEEQIKSRRKDLRSREKRRPGKLPGNDAEVAIEEAPRGRTSMDDSGNRPAVVEATPQFHMQNPRPRRHTLPVSPSALPDFPALRRSATIGLAKLRNQTRSYLSLTSAQATVLKWLYAAYTYAVVLVAILGPIRIYVGALALGGNEPIGWALGYLFGDIAWFRLQVVLWNLERWICLPPRLVPLTSTETYFRENSGTTTTLGPGRIDQLRLFVVGAANTRLAISAYCLVSIAAGLMVVFRLSSVADVDTRRKVFHGMMVSMFGPTTFIDPAFIALALALVLAIFLLLDLFRASQLPPVSRPLTVFLAPYVDGRDHRGPVVVSHIFLLVGCAIPLWLSLSALPRGYPPSFSSSIAAFPTAFTGWEVPSRDLSMVSGIVCVGMGDAAASLVGRRFGRRRWPWSGGKSLEGSAAFAGAVVLGLSLARAWLVWGGWGDDGIGGVGGTSSSWPSFVLKAAVAACGASFTEAVLTGANDNVLVPIVLWLLVRGLGV